MEDTQFLVYETPTSPMHVGGLMIFERGPLATEDGGVDIETIRKGVASVLHKVPRFRQRLKWIPVANHPVWVDDPHLDIRYHVRHTSLPRPGSMAQLKQLVARVMSQQLDRDKPLWEWWVIEGLEDDAFAVFTKIHHCMMDGTSGADLSHVLMNVEPEWSYVEPPPYVPRPEPSDAELLRDAVVRRARQPFEAARRLGHFFREAEDLGGQLQTRLRALGATLGSGAEPASSPITGALSPHRRADWRVMSVAELRAIRRKAGTTLNDVVLAIVAGAFRGFFEHRCVDPDQTKLKTTVPVNVHADDDRELGNKISTWMFELPIDEADPIRRLELIAETTEELKQTQQALGTHLLMQFVEFAPTSILSLAARASQGVCDTFVTNVPGPQFPLFMFGARMRLLLPQVPLLPGMGIGVGLMSYDGKVCWGFTSDAKLVPDIEEFGDALEASFAELGDAYGVGLGD
jgi:WS/DGAT/MGAT family acyltransferase